MYQKNINKTLIKECSKGTIDGIELLLEFQANVNCKNGLPLIIAAKNKHTKVIKFLLKHNANININEDNVFIKILEYGTTYHEILKLLLKNGSNINANGGYALRQNIKSIILIRWNFY